MVTWKKESLPVDLRRMFSQTTPCSQFVIFAARNKGKETEGGTEIDTERQKKIKQGKRR